MSKYLLGGLSLTGISTGFMYFGERIDKFSALEEEMNISSDGEKPEELLRRVGLECSGQYCWPSRRREFNVERDKREENLALGYGHRGKLRIHRGSVGYLGGFRFTVEGSSIPLYIRKFWKRSPVEPLEEYENYGIKKDGEKYYLSRTKNSKEGMILELGLPDSCVLPVKGENTCKVLHVEGVGFGEGLNGLVDGEASLTITETKDESFSGGYKFTFTFPQDVTINGRVIRAKSPTDFRLKRHEDGHLTLEKAWENEKELLDKVGLVCEENGNCSLKSGGTLKIKKAENQEFKEITDISPGKIKLYKYDDDYFNGLRLQVEGEKIGSGDNTLEEFETYEIKEKGDEYYLLLKRSSDERIKELLKYPCSLSTSPSTCNVSNERNLNAINFEGKGESTLSLQKEMVIIAVSKAPKDDFPVGRKFTFNFPEDVTIGNKVVKAYSPTDFKLKRHDNGDLTLERAWTEENELIGKVGMSCGADNNCTFNNGELKVRKDGKELQISNIGKGKIKLYKDTSRYSNGFKFAIEGGKIGTGENVLEEFETYEIKDVEGKYYLVLKTKAEEKIKELLNFPSKCFASEECSISNEEEFKNIKFEGKDVDSISIGSKKVKITVSTAPEGDFPFSRKFTFTFPEDVTIGGKDVKTNAPTDFKLKNNGGNLSLEKAWANENDLIGKVGLNCETDGNCTIKNGSIKVRKDSKMIQLSELKGEGKIKLSKDAAGYSNGLKFEIEGGKIGADENVLEEFETYEISEDESGYYLKLKTSTDKKIKELLKFPGRCSLSSCSGLTEEEIKKINFENKNDSSISIKAGQTVKITVSKAPEGDYILGRKFTLESSENLSISNSISVKAKTPTEFKIKREGTSLSLEKAWTLNTLTKKVGLSCTDNICTITPNSLNVKKENSLLKDLSEKDPKGTGKIKVIEGQADYNDGLKFQIQDGNINLSISGGQTLVLEEFETYEIKNDGKNHYLERKKSALQGKWEALGLPEQCRSKFDNTTNGCSISFEDLKKIKFSGKDANKSINAEGARYWLKTSSDDSLPKGIKVKVEVRGEAVKIPKENDRTMILWKDYETEFRVKDEKNGNYSLEGTFDVNALVKTIGITNGDCDDELGCTIGGTVNVRESGTKYWKGATVDKKDQDKRITYRLGVNKGVDKDKDKFNKNIAFRVPDEGIKLTGGSQPPYYLGDINCIRKGTYEIQEYTIGSNNNNESIPYLSKEEPTSWLPNDEFFNND